MPLKLNASNNTDLIELETFPRPGQRSPKRFFDMATTTPPTTVNHNKKQEKKGLKERIFGTRRPSNKGSPKFDVVRSVEILNYNQTSDNANDTIDGQRELRKTSFTPIRPSFIHDHRFDPHGKPTWCDVCEDFIWGLYTQAMRCQYCRYTCHAKCVKYVELDCPKAPSSEKTREDLTKETLEILSEGYVDLEEKKNNNLPSFVSTISQLRKLIEDYNDKSSLIMTLHDDCTFDGFIRVHMNLNRPVNVSSDVSNLTLKKAVQRSKRPLSNSRRPVSELFPSVSATMGSSSSTDDSGIGSQSSTISSVESAAISASFGSRNGKRPARRLSFYMPKGTYKPLHVTSTTTVREVIEALLSKYNVTDNPKKFALYEKYNKKQDSDKEVIYRKLAEDEHPLSLCLSWGGKNLSRTFAMKEDEEGIQWMNFEIPELKNFLKILQMEEDELLAQIYQKFDTYGHTLKRAIDSKAVDVAYTSEA